MLTGVPDGAECSREEIFGPVITVETLTDETDAVARANAVPYGLAASVRTENARRGHDIPTRLDFGTVWVNAHLVLANAVVTGRRLRCPDVPCDGCCEVRASLRRATGIGGSQGSQRWYRGTVEPCARAEIATLI